MGGERAHRARETNQTETANRPAAAGRQPLPGRLGRRTRRPLARRMGQPCALGGPAGASQPCGGGCCGAAAHGDAAGRRALPAARYGWQGGASCVGGVGGVGPLAPCCSSPCYRCLPSGGATEAQQPTQPPLLPHASRCLLRSPQLVRTLQVVVAYHPHQRQLAAETLALYLHIYHGVSGQEAVEVRCGRLAARWAGAAAARRAACIPAVAGSCTLVCTLLHGSSLAPAEPMCLLLPCSPRALPRVPLLCRPR